jgi:signal transduction histidine kinase/HD-like signal output (HDOD) protein
MTQMGAQSADEFATRKVELVLQQLESLPTLPAIAVRLLSLTGSSTSKVQEVADLIAMDGALTAKVLSLVNSAAAGARQAVTTVQQAIVMLGFDAIRNLALSVKVFEVFQQDSSEGGVGGSFSRAEFWKHALAVATCAETLAWRCKPALPAADGFVCGLLHDLGKVAFDAVMPKSFGRVVEIALLTRGDISDVERRIIGLDHALAGKRLAEAWGLPPLIAQTMWLHGVTPESVPPGLSSPNMVRLIGLADLLARRQHIGFSGNFQTTYDVQQYLTPLGLTDADLAAATDKLTEAMELKARGIGLYEVRSRTLYLESIANANAELGRANQQHAVQNAKLAQRSECFDLLAQFYQRIAPAATPAQLLAEIGQLAQGYLRSGRVVLFSQDPEQSAGEMVLLEGGARQGGGGGQNPEESPSFARDSRVLSMPPFGGDLRYGRGSSRYGNALLRPARPQLDWLLEHVPEAQAGGTWQFMPLLCGEMPIGGLLWQEAQRALAPESDLRLVAQAWGMTLRSAQMREQHNILTEALAASNRSLGAVQQQLVRTKSLASLGEMAAGAAHEMNNPLAVVCGRAQLLAGRLADPAAKQDALQIAQQGDRLSQIITDLMAFAKPAAPKLEATAIGPLLEQAVAEARQRSGVHGAAIPVRVDAGANLPRVALDTEQIRLALVEILLNALQATGEVVSKQPGAMVAVQVRFEPVEGQLIIQIGDQGPGMSEAVLKQAFAPFFSAKPAGRQRGMGLAKALRWVELHGGTIRMDSTPNVGTTVVVLLPVTGA